jgi:hypothetical protein
VSSKHVEELQEQQRRERAGEGLSVERSVTALNEAIELIWRLYMFFPRISDDCHGVADEGMEELKDVLEELYSKLTYIVTVAVSELGKSMPPAMRQVALQAVNMCALYWPLIDAYNKLDLYYMSNRSEAERGHADPALDKAFENAMRPFHAEMYKLLIVAQGI